MTVTGVASFGAVSSEGAYGDTDFVIESDVDLFITGRTETDSGIALSATVEMESLGGSNYKKTSATNTTTTVFSISGGFGAVTFGNTDGAADRNTTETHRVYRDVDYELWGGRVDNNDVGEILRYDYKLGDAQMSASYAGDVDRWGVGASWSGDVGGNAKVSVGFGYEDGDDLADFITVSAGVDFGPIGARVAYWQADNAVTGVQVAELTDVSLQYSDNGLTVGAGYHMNDISGTDNYDVFVTYDLGGGAKVFAQHGTRDFGATAANPGAEQDVSSFGVSFTF